MELFLTLTSCSNVSPWLFLLEEQKVLPRRTAYFAFPATQHQKPEQEQNDTGFKVP